VAKKVFLPRNQQKARKGKTAMAAQQTQSKWGHLLRFPYFSCPFLAKSVFCHGNTLKTRKGKAPALQRGVVLG
jgi:hypothetical protein